MPLKRLSRIILFVGDMNSMSDFYSKVLGLPIIDDSESGFVVLDAGGSQLLYSSNPCRVCR